MSYALVGRGPARRLAQGCGLGLRWVAGCLGLALVFVWGGALRWGGGGLIAIFLGLFCWCWQNFGGGLAAWLSLYGG